MRVAPDYFFYNKVKNYKTSNLDPSASKNEVSADSSDRILQRDENVGKCRFDDRYSMLYMFKYVRNITTHLIRGVIHLKTVLF